MCWLYLEFIFFELTSVLLLGFLRVSLAMTSRYTGVDFKFDQTSRFRYFGQTFTGRCSGRGSGLAGYDGAAAIGVKCDALVQSDSGVNLQEKYDKSWRNTIVPNATA
jgi:hypothetical protein